MNTILAFEDSTGMKYCEVVPNAPQFFIENRDFAYEMARSRLQTSGYQTKWNDYAYQHFINAGHDIKNMVILRDDGDDRTYTYDQYKNSAPWMSGYND